MYGKKEKKMQCMFPHESVQSLYIKMAGIKAAQLYPILMTAAYPLTPIEQLGSVI